MIWKTLNLLFSFYLNSFQNNTETFGNDAAEITAETKSDLDELIKKTVSKNEMNENYSREKKRTNPFVLSILHRILILDRMMVVVRVQNC